MQEDGGELDYADACLEGWERSARAYHREFGGTLDARRKARVAGSLKSFPVWVQLLAMEIYTDRHSNKDETYLGGIARKLGRLNEEELLDSATTHRQSMNGAGIFDSVAEGRSKSAENEPAEATG